MRCSEIELLLPDLLEGLLTPTQAHQVEQHLDDCPTCAREAAATERMFTALTRAAGEVISGPDLWAGLQSRLAAQFSCADTQLLLAAYLERELDGTRAQSVAAHVHSCEACAAELESHRRALLALEAAAPQRPQIDLWAAMQDKLDRPRMGGIRVWLGRAQFRLENISSGTLRFASVALIGALGLRLTFDVHVALHGPDSSDPLVAFFQNTLDRPVEANPSSPQRDAASQDQRLLASRTTPKAPVDLLLRVEKRRFDSPRFASHAAVRPRRRRTPVAAAPAEPAPEVLVAQIPPKWNTGGELEPTVSYPTGSFTVAYNVGVVTSEETIPHPDTCQRPEVKSELMPDVVQAISYIANLQLPAKPGAPWER